MRIHLVIEDDQGETYRIENKGDEYSLLYNPITDTSEEPLSYSELFNRINFALREGLNIEIENIDAENKYFRYYRENKITYQLFNEILTALEHYHISIRRSAPPP